MTYLQIAVSALANCNMHFALYGGFGAAMMSRAILDWRARHYDEAREHTVHGMMYLGLGML